MTPPPADPATPEPGHTGTTVAPTPLDVLHSHLDTHLTGTARTWFHQALDEAAAHPGTHGPISVWELRLAEAGRRCGSRYADAARVLILHAARADPDALARVYFQGTADERRAVLHALPHLVPGPDAVPLVEDALRTHDTRLLAAAVGPYAARHLGAHAWRHAILKCLFVGVPVDAVAGLEQRARADAELARMLADHAAERTAAGRPVPPDLHRVLTLADPGTPTAPTRPAPPPQTTPPSPPTDPPRPDPNTSASHRPDPHTPGPYSPALVRTDLHDTDPHGTDSPHSPAHPHGKES
ncbi:EboA domain-containing protein [Streptomyces sp. NBC_01485]|uniref:EboA domain-containing protein n=1 Tax=Streptomyces sp. NBC_01485 TaxID=2903884 RepID=UPI002E344B99|nr:EboA domain-containing protein [Streptomyces sp. NBC_01485]